VHASDITHFPIRKFHQHICSRLAASRLIVSGFVPSPGIQAERMLVTSEPRPYTWIRTLTPSLMRTKSFNDRRMAHALLLT